MRTILTIVLVVAVGLAGCKAAEDATKALKRKFTRPKKEKERVVRFYEEEYEPEFPNATLYNNHYVYWKSWEGELIEALQGDNHKKQLQCAKLALSELRLMQKYLVSPKKEELTPFIKELEGITTRIAQGSLGHHAKSKFRTALEKHRRRVLKGYYLKKVKDWIKEDVRRIPEETS